MKNLIKRLFGEKSTVVEDTIPSYLSAVSAWLERNACPIKSNLNGAASESDIKDIESELNIQMPATLREAYLIHDGEKSDSDGIFGLWRWLSLCDMKKEFHLLKEHKDSDAVRIPILLSPGGDILYAESGPESEIIDWWHENPSRDVKHVNFKAYLQWFVNSLHEGGYVFLPDEMSGLVDKSEL